MAASQTEVMLKVIEALEELDSPYLVGGSYASSAHGIARATMDKKSERQWSDVLGVMSVQADKLDLEYLRHWAIELGVRDLLERALVQSQGEPS